MSFKPKNNANPNGRPVGAKAKPIKDKLENLLQKNFKVIERDLELSNAAERRDFFVKLAAVVISDLDTNCISTLLSNHNHA